MFLFSLITRYSIETSYRSLYSLCGQLVLVQELRVLKLLVG